MQRKPKRVSYRCRRRHRTTCRRRCTRTSRRKRSRLRVRGLKPSSGPAPEQHRLKNEERTGARDRVLAVKFTVQSFGAVLLSSVYIMGPFIVFGLCVCNRHRFTAGVRSWQRACACVCVRHTAEHATYRGAVDSVRE